MVPYHRGRVYIFFRRSNYSIDAWKEIALAKLKLPSGCSMEFRN
jgi:hypothetical protein